MLCVGAVSLLRLVQNRVMIVLKVDTATECLICIYFLL